MSNNWPQQCPYSLAPVYKDGEFLGRRDELDKLHIAVSDRRKTRALVSGPRRFGKTCLLYRLKHELGEFGTAVVAYLDCLTLGERDPQSLTGRMLSRLSELVAAELGIATPTSVSNPMGLMNASDNRRLVLLIDEAQFLQEVNPWTMPEILDAFPATSGQDQGPPPPLLVLSWGRPIGHRFNHKNLSERLKIVSDDFELGPLDRETTDEAAKLALAYSFAEDACGLIWEITKGHPLYISIINQMIYETRRSDNNTELVTAREVLDVVLPACSRFRQAVNYAWNQIDDNDQRLVVKAIAALTSQVSANDPIPFLDFVSHAEIVKETQEHRDNLISVTELDRACEGLIQNCVLKKNGDQFTLNSPFLGYWLSDKSYEALLQERDTDWHYRRADAYWKQNDFSSARRELREALLCDGKHPESNILLAELEVAAGDVDAAIQCYETAALRRAKDVAAPLASLLVDRIVRAVQQREDPARWLRTLANVSPELLRDQRVTSSLCRHRLDRWEAHLQEGDYDLAGRQLQTLADENPLGWRLTAARRYAELMRTAAKSETWLQSCLVAVRDAFLLLTEQRIDSNESAEKPEWWLETIYVFDLAWERQLDTEEFVLSAQTLGDLALRAPKAIRADLLDCYLRWLPGRLSELLKRDPREALAMIRVLCEYSNAESRPIAEIWGALETNAISIADDRNDGRALRFFREGASIYTYMLEKGSNSEERTKQAWEQIQLVIARVMKPSASQDEFKLVLEAPAEIELWRRLLLGPSLGKLDSATELAHKLLPPAERMYEGFDDRPEAVQLVRSVLAGRLAKHKLELLDPLPFEPRGVSRTHVRLYHANFQGAPVTVKVYDLAPIRDPAARELLKSLWSKERRVLFDIATRRHGRGLTQLKFSHFDDEENLMLTVTEPLGDTLRDFLDEDRLPLIEGLWHELQALLEAVDTLHKADYMHRDIRPENIYVVRDQGGRLRLKLGNFEWSIYLHSLAAVQPHDRRLFDRYFAPEVLGMHFGHGGDFGENFGSDIFSLGIVLFEVLVRRLRQSERKVFSEAEHYDAELESKWLSHIQSEVRAKLTDTAEARDLLLPMIRERNQQRVKQLDEAIESAERIALCTTEIQQLLDNPNLRPQLITSLSRRSPRSIANLLVKAGEDDFETDADVREFLESELRLAKIYRNGGSSQHPLLLIGRRHVFTATPFKYGDKPFPSMPVITLARSNDRATGPLLAQLPAQPDILDMQFGRDSDTSQMLAKSTRRGRAWTRLFELAENPSERLGPRQRELHRLLGVTSEIERRTWEDAVVPYEVVERLDPEGPVEAVRIRLNKLEQVFKPLKGVRSLTQFVTQQVSRDMNEFELGRKSSPVARFDDNLWIPEHVDHVKDEVVMVRGKDRAGEAAPDTGYLRPKSLEGNRTIYRRRGDVLRRLEDDAYLLTAVSETSKLFGEGFTTTLEFKNQALDSDKQRIVRRVMDTRPLYVVQGPPGTGKTTLAAEVIQQVLAENPSSRILVTCQSHDPLNNLLLRVDEALEANRAKGETRAERKRFSEAWERQKPMAIRLVSPANLSRIYDASSAVSIAERFHPGEVARKRLAEARAWEPPPGSEIDVTLADRWRAFIDKNKDKLTLELHGRIINSANIVYITANDRMVSDLPAGQTFDMLIYEEAAKAYPLEILGPMSLARRWLLIGDHNQLPPFDIENFRTELLDTLTEATAAPQGTPILERLGLDDKAPHLAIEFLEFFEWLYEKGKPTSSRPIQFSDHLSTQWRMHPDIANMVSEIYYRDVPLRNGDDDYLLKACQHPLVKPDGVNKVSLIWIDMPMTRAAAGEFESGEGDAEAELWSENPHRGGGYRNTYEAAILLQFMKQVQTRGYGGFKSVMLLSPYRAQVKLLHDFFSTWKNVQTGGLQNKSGTVDSAQGRQAQVVVVSLVRNNTHPVNSGSPDEIRRAYGFLESQQRAGVMFSRAESLLVVIGCSRHFAKSESFHINQVYRHICQHGLVIDARELMDEHNLKRFKDHDQRRRDKVLARRKQFEAEGGSQ